MIAAAATPWIEANQQYLAAKLDLLALALRQYAGNLQGNPQDLSLAEREARETLLRAEAAMPSSPAAEILRSKFRLSPFEYDLLLLAAGVELDRRVAELCAVASGDLRRPALSFGLALALFPASHWSAMSPNAPLRYWRLLEHGAGELVTTMPVRIDERVLHYISGVDACDEKLAGVVYPVSSGVLVPSHQAIAAQVTELWTASNNGNAPPVQLCGEESEAIRSIAFASCRALGMGVLAFSSRHLSGAAGEMDNLRRLLEREAAIGSSALLLEMGEVQSERDAGATVAEFVEQLRIPLLVSSPRRGMLRSRALATLDVGRPTREEQQTLWHNVLPEAAALNGDLGRLVQQFDLHPAQIRSAATTLRTELAPEAQADAGQLFRSLWSACRKQCRPRLDDLAQQVDCAASWRELILPVPQMQVLREIAMQVRHRQQVYEQWGFAARSPRGLGIGALFCGSSGTGKTLASEVLATELNLDLYRIDLSSVVSKYIGETEKNLRRVFDAAEEGGAILLFDEADALFGKRSEVRDSHDRYANLEVSYLLQRMEAYRGLAVLTTNMKSALDGAFVRRIRFIVHFPFPNPAERAAIWRSIFPSQTPTENLDAAKLARLNVTGGNIRNIALSACFFAAEENEPVGMKHVLKATRSEYAKLEKPLTDSEIGGWL